MATFRSPEPWGGCRLHGPGCLVPWGFDRTHTDSPRPYTDEELAARAEPPHRYAYPTREAYLQGFYLWRALRNDALLTRAEADAWLATRAEAAGFTGGTLNEIIAELQGRL